MDEPNGVALYARVSSQRQADEMTIQSQVSALRERIEQDGMKVTEELSFLDEGYSGATLVRPALERLRDMACVRCQVNLGEEGRSCARSSDHGKRFPSASLIG